LSFENYKEWIALVKNKDIRATFVHERKKEGDLYRLFFDLKEFYVIWKGSLIVTVLPAMKKFKMQVKKNLTNKKLKIHRPRLVEKRKLRKEEKKHIKQEKRKEKTYAKEFEKYKDLYSFSSIEGENNV